MAILRTMSERLRETNAMLSERAAKNVDEEFEKNLSWSDRLADRWPSSTAAGTSSGLLVLTAVWCAINRPGAAQGAARPLSVRVLQPRPGDPGRPAGPADRDEPEPAIAEGSRAAETDFKVNLKNEVNIETMLRELGEFRPRLKHPRDKR